jgi:hypothetical protein
MWLASISLFNAGNRSHGSAHPTITDWGESSRVMRHISRTLPTFTIIPVMPTTSY